MRAKLNSIVLVPGGGALPGLEIGGEAVKLKKLLGTPDTHSRRGDKYFCEGERTYFGGALVVDSLCSNSVERIARVSVSIGRRSTAGFGVEQPRLFLRLQSKDLPLNPTNILARSEALALFGEPKVAFTSFEKSGLEAIRAGVSYRVLDKDIGVEYLHYPEIGLALVLERERVVKISVENKRQRQIWRF